MRSSVPISLDIALFTTSGLVHGPPRSMTLSSFSARSSFEDSVSETFTFTDLSASNSSARSFLSLTTFAITSEWNSAVYCCSKRSACTCLRKTSFCLRSSSSETSGVTTACIGDGWSGEDCKDGVGCLVGVARDGLPRTFVFSCFSCDGASPPRIA